MAGLRLYLCYAPEDLTYSRRLEQCLAPLVRDGALSTFSSQRLLPGDQVDDAQQQELAAAQVLVLLVTPDLVASDALWALYQRAKTRADLRVIPVLVRPSSYAQTDLKDLQPLPADRLEVTLWSNQDAAWLAIGDGLARLVQPRTPPRSEEPARRRWRWMAAPLVGLALVGGLLLSLRPPLGMVRLPGGPFTLGEPYRDARSVPPYWLDREEVTQEDFLGWLTQRGVKREPAGARDEDGALLWEPQAASLTTATRPRLPAVGVTYEGAQRFCQARGRRLVRYEEWDLAARGAERMLSFPWGEEPPRCAGVVFARQSAREGAFAACQGDGAGPREVGSAPQDHSAEGVRDLAGNVSEWVEVPGANRYSRGGSFARPAESCHSGYYSQLEPGAGYMDVGFRCARDAGRWRF